MSYEKLKELILSHGYLSFGIMSVFCLSILFMVYLLLMWVTASKGMAIMLVFVAFLPTDIILNMLSLDGSRMYLSISLGMYVSVFFWLAFFNFIGILTYKLYLIKNEK